MQISKSPIIYSSAFLDAAFVLTANPDELLIVDIYDNAMTKVIGQKRFTGASEYEMNVSGYVRRQMSVTPLTPNQSGFYAPAKRSAMVKIKCGNVSRTTMLTAGMVKPMLFTKLSHSPEVTEITPSQRYEYTLLNDDAILSVRCVFTKEQLNHTVALPNCAVEFDFASLSINMPDMALRLRTAGGGEPADYDMMTIYISNDYGHPDHVLQFRIVPDRPDDVRLCWWSYHGHIDYHTMRKVGEGFSAQKDRAYTADGYKTIGSVADRSIEMVSDYCDRKTMEWLREIAASPAVWMDTPGGMVPIEITTGEVTTSTYGLSRIELKALYRTRQTFQHL